MKSMTNYLFIFFILLQTTYANQCESDSFREENICIIAGGAADTTKTLNLAHARSLSLRNARIIAYEKMAERLEGVIIGAQTTQSGDLISDGQVKTIVQATLKNVEIQKESVSFLSDGSPWAEVTLSVPKKGKMGVETKVLEFTNGHNSLKEKDEIIVIDLREYNYKKSHFYELKSPTKKIFAFNSFIGKSARFVKDVDHFSGKAIKLMRPIKIDNSNIILNETDAIALVMAEHSKNIIEKKNLYILTK
ncbi:hypothetical protein A9Q84_14485 [Halobacteriovorax marinus]|uniref:Uncharacterized protein n=1 Tax=Halobacteriovorax marinus TaxID=97084 RepID=A0A1Y5F8V5_9BACT|nr:hypothetical protein A9Q84_14485 [Halobacteriovorax marinus]